MTARSLSRAAFLSLISGAAVFAAAPSAFATPARNAEAEAYVQANASAALAALRPNAQPQEFYTLMQRFADMPSISAFVLGSFGAQLRTNPTLRADWQRGFQDYAIAFYQTRLNAFSGSTIRVTSSIERQPGRDAIVITEITPRGGGRTSQVQWRILKRSTGEWKVTDVALLQNGTEVWLAQQQQRDFTTALGANHGNIPELLQTIRQQTAAMRERTARG